MATRAEGGQVERCKWNAENRMTDCRDGRLINQQRSGVLVVVVRCVVYAEEDGCAQEGARREGALQGVLQGGDVEATAVVEKSVDATRQWWDVVVRNDIVVVSTMLLLEEDVGAGHDEFFCSLC